MTILKSIFAVTILLALSSLVAAQPSINNFTLNNGLPPKTKVTKLGDEIYLNGVPTLMIGIAVPMSIKETSKFFGNRWSAEGWAVNLDKSGDLILVTATDGTFQKVASLTKTGAESTEGSISLTDMPLRLKTGEGYQLPVGEHLMKPVKSMVLNEVRIRDAVGESIMTTLTNPFDVEQNAAFYQERMVEDGWKLKRRKTVEENKSLILVFEKPGKESTFTFVRQKRQSFVTVNWINR